MRTMGVIPLTNGGITLVDSRDWDELMKFGWYKDSHGYAVRNEYLGKIGGKYRNRTILMHRVIMNPPDKMDVDHANHETLDNRRYNLRVCTRSQNMMNRKPLKGKTLPKGVSINPSPRSLKKFMVRISKDGRSKFVGNYKTIKEAELAYQAAAQELHGEFKYA